MVINQFGSCCCSISPHLASLPAPKKSLLSLHSCRSPCWGWAQRCRQGQPLATSLVLSHKAPHTEPCTHLLPTSVPPKTSPQRDKAAPKPFPLPMLLMLELLQMSDVTSCGLPHSFHPPWAADIRPPTPPSPHIAAFIPHSWAHFCLLPPASLNRPLLS